MRFPEHPSVDMVNSAAITVGLCPCQSHNIGHSKSTDTSHQLDYDLDDNVPHNLPLMLGPAKFAWMT